MINNLEQDVRDGMEYLKKENKDKKSAAAALYGAATKIPTGFLVDEVLRCCVRASLKWSSSNIQISIIYNTENSKYPLSSCIHPLLIKNQ